MGPQQHKNQLRYGSLSWFTALCHQYVVTLPLISTPRHKTTHCTAEARFAVPFSNLYPLSHLSNAKYSRRPTEMQKVKEVSPHMSANPTVLYIQPVLLQYAVQTSLHFQLHHIPNIPLISTARSLPTFIMPLKLLGL